jgi:hypothetical protein
MKRQLTRAHREAIHRSHVDRRRFELYAEIRRRIEELWDLVSKPIKFPAPARRRRSDRELPRAA